MEKVECTLLINSCDSYNDLWEPFCVLLKKHWAGLDFPVVLNTESRDFTFDGLELRTIHSGGGLSWSQRLRRVLEAIQTEYVIMLLDDYLLEAPVKKDVVLQCIEYMNKDKQIASFSFMPQPGPNVEDARYEGFLLRGKKAPYRTSTQACIWRRSLLLKYLRAHENAWQFEIWGSIRSRRYPYRLYCSASKKTEAFDYSKGRIIIRGKYYRPDVERVERQQNITLNTQQRGFTEVDLSHMPPRPFKDTVRHYLKIKTYLDVLRSLI